MRVEESDNMLGMHSIRAFGGGGWSIWPRGRIWVEPKQWDRLRCKTLAHIPKASGRKGEIALVYADGNAMGKRIRQLRSPEAFRYFARVVDDSIHEACFAALESVCRKEIENIVNWVDRTTRKSQADATEGEDSANADRSRPMLHADILLLGGDDLLVVLPAEQGLAFARLVAENFRELTAQKMSSLPDPSLQEAFGDEHWREGFTVSCGVAFAKGDYPVYLLLNLAEELLRSAKTAGSAEVNGTRGQKPAITWGIDFHKVTSANTHALSYVRKKVYYVDSPLPRTLRPLDSQGMERLKKAAERLKQGRLPGSKLNEFWEAALHPNPHQAQLAVKEVFARCRTINERRAVWEATEQLCPPGWTMEFPILRSSKGNGEPRRVLPIADLIEVCELLDLD